jgi:hypothetical protein
MGSQMTLEAFLAAASVLVPSATWGLDKLGLRVPKLVYGAVAVLSLTMLGVAGGLYFAGSGAPKIQPNSAMISTPTQNRTQEPSLSVATVVPLPAPKPPVHHRHHRGKPAQTPTISWPSLIQAAPSSPNQATLPLSQPSQQNCAVTGGTNYGKIEQNCNPPAPRP